MDRVAFAVLRGRRDPRWGRSLRCLLLGAACALACGGSEPGAPSPRSPVTGEGDEAISTPRDMGAGASDAEAALPEGPEPGSEAGAAEPSPSEPALPEGPELELDATFHRTRVGPGRGFWVLATLSNPHAQALSHARLLVRLLAEDGTMLLEVQGERGPSLDAGESAVVAVLVEAPVEHEQLELRASGIGRGAPSLGPAPSVELQHDPPMRAKLGGYFVLGQATNTGSEALSGARIEVRGISKGGELLGVDWFELAPLEPGETAPFDLGGLRYEEPPERFELSVRD